MILPTLVQESNNKTTTTTPMTTTTTSNSTTTTTSTTSTTTTTTTTSTSSATTTSTTTSSKKPKLTQLFLDFGQKGISSCHCPTCHMCYAPGNEEDEQAHRLYHKRFVQPVLMRATDTDTCCWRSERNNMCVLKFSLERADHRVRTNALLQRMNKHLLQRTAVDDDDDDKASGSRANKTVYVCLKGRQCMGGLVVEVNHDLRGAAVASSRGPAVARRPTRWLEIVQIWVEPKYRLEGVARRLVDLSRSETVYGEWFKEEQCRMFARTLDGDHFWGKYVGGNGKKKKKNVK
jgi:GNAT superfamily N-acetyltransferase